MIENYKAEGEGLRKQIENMEDKLGGIEESHKLNVIEVGEGG